MTNGIELETELLTTTVEQVPLAAFPLSTIEVWSALSLEPSDA